jgi:hypothetical protein
VFIWECSEVASDFAEQGLDAEDVDGGDLGEVHSEYPLVLGAEFFGLGGLVFGLAALGGGAWALFVVVFVGAAQGLGALLDLRFELRDLVLKMGAAFPCESEDEEVFFAPVSVETFEDGFGPGFDSAVPVLGEFFGVAFASDDGLYDGAPGRSGDVVDDVLNLDVHLPRFASPCGLPAAGYLAPLGCVSAAWT